MHLLENQVNMYR